MMYLRYQLPPAYRRGSRAVRGGNWTQSHTFGDYGVDFAAANPLNAAIPLDMSLF
jgi:hypothetical protein